MGRYTIERPLRVFSSGAGTQSTATVVLQANGVIEPFDLHIFANVGNDSEHPKTLAYLHDHLIPYAQRHGIEIVVTTKKARVPERATLYQSLLYDRKSTRIPMRFKTGKQGNRSCTVDYKVLPVRREISARKPEYVELGIGFSTDEMRRVIRKQTDWHNVEHGRRVPFMQRYTFPLVEAGVSRADCARIVTDAGLPPAPRSACFFCPFTKRAEWLRMKREEPEQFEQCCALEEAINANRALEGREPVYFHPDARPLRIAVGDQLTLFDIYDDADSECQNHCHT